MKQDLIVRAYREGDEEGIYELWQVVHPEDHRNRDEWMRWWHWMYKENPAGEGLIRLAEDNGRIISHHALIPIWLKVNNKTVLGSWGVDAMTHPEYRRRGIWESVIKELWDEAANNGIDITPGFPNQFSFTGLTKKLDWFEISSATLAFRPIDWKSTITLKVRNRFLSKVLAAIANIVFGKSLFRTRKVLENGSVTIRRITSFDERFSRLWAKVSQQYLIMTARTKDYLNWRFSRPDCQYEILAAEQDEEIRGYVVLGNGVLRGVRVAHIVDMVAESEEVMRNLVSECIKICQRDRFAILIFNFIAGKNYRRPLKKEGFLFSPFIRGGLFCARLNSDRIPQTLLQKPRNWLVQPADTDTI